MRTLLLFSVARTASSYYLNLSQLSPHLVNAPPIFFGRQFTTRSMALSNTHAENNHASTSSSLADFLTFQKSQLEQHLQQQTAEEQQQHQSLLAHFVIGNPAGDADSIVSAIALSYVDSLIANSTACVMTTKFPIISIPEHDLKTSRPETTFLLQLAGISIDSLVCLDHPNVLSFTSQQHKHKVSLVDHNRLVFAAEESWEVVEILDHHMDERAHTDSCPSNTTTVEGGGPYCRNIAFSNNQALVASTCTLIVERYMANLIESSNPAVPTFTFPMPLAILLLGVILLDSVNMSPHAGKGTLRDQAAMDSLLKHTDWSSLPLLLDNNAPDIMDTTTSTSTRPDPTKLFDTLQKQKFDPVFWNQLSTRDALALDYKSFASQPTTCTSTGNSIGGGIGGGGGVFGVSTVLQSMQDFMSKPDHLEAIQGYMQERSIPLLGIMFSVSTREGRLGRQLCICTTTTTLSVGEDEDGESLLLLQGMVDFLLGTELQLTVRDDLITRNNVDVGVRIVYMDQGNTKASRKQVAPIMMEYWK
jgi:inorganic pyrophosphatase/exopolyphosphatase